MRRRCWLKRRSFKGLRGEVSCSGKLTEWYAVPVQLHDVTTQRILMFVIKCQGMAQLVKARVLHEHIIVYMH